MQPNLMKSMAIGAAAVVAALGAWSLGKSSAAPTSSPAVQPAGAQAPQRGQGGPAGPAPSFGTPATGAAADKAEKAALARYPGQVERVVQLDDGSYVVHVITSAGEEHVAVSKDFEVTGADQGGPGGAPPLSPAGRSSTVSYEAAGS